MILFTFYSETYKKLVSVRDDYLVFYQDPFKIFPPYCQGCKHCMSKRKLPKVDVKQLLQHLISVNISIEKCKIQGLNLLLIKHQE